MKDRNIWRFLAIIMMCLCGMLSSYIYVLEKKNSRSEEISVKNTVDLKLTLPTILDSLNKVRHQVQVTSEMLKTPDTPKPSTPNKKDTLGQISTALSIANTVALQKELKSYKISDSLGKIRIASLLSDLQKEKASKRNVYIATKEVPNRNALISFQEIKKRNGRLSPNRPYLRVTNLTDSGTINSMPYYDYQLASDEIYQLLGQIRTSYTPDINRWTIGIGVELKANRFSLNFANSYVPKSPSNKWINPTFGLRYDVVRFPIR